MNQYLGEIISLGVALSWTLTAMAAEVASRYASALIMNVVRMLIALPLFFLLLFFTTGSWFPLYADASTWMWLSLAGLVGYVFGDICLFRSYQEMGSRYGQLFMTLAPLFSTFGGWMLLNEKLPAKAMIAILLVLTGIALSVFGRGNSEKKIALKISGKAALLGLGAALGQGVGLVLSKIGMLSYTNSLPAGVDADSVMMPFAATFIRCTAALIGFVLIMLWKGETSEVPKMLRNRKAMTALTVATFFGPFIGVSFSLLAVVYTSTGIAATLMALVPIFILLPSRIFFKQQITRLDILGSLVAVGGVAILFIE